MGSSVFYVGLVLLACSISVSHTQTITDDEGPFRQQRNVEFDWTLAKQMFSSEKSNTVLSPLMVKIMLTLLYEGTGVSSFSLTLPVCKELQLVLGPEGDLQATRMLYRSLINSASFRNDSYKLKFGIKYFADEKLGIIQKYQSIISYYYDAEADNVPFSNPKKAIEVINKWASEETDGDIKEIVSESSIKEAIIALISFVQFKGTWSYPFAENGESTFYTASKKQVSTDYMERSGKFYYEDSAVLKAQLLRLPYKGGKFAMYLILPHQDNSIDDVMGRITPETLHQSLTDMDRVDVNVTIPKFKFEFAKDMIQPLNDIGVHTIFSPLMSLSLLARGQAPANKSKISQMVQKTAITVNEGGSEAVSATGDLVNKVGDGGDGMEVFNANRPFVFFVEDEKTGAVMLVGKVDDPTQQNDDNTA